MIVIYGIKDQLNPIKANLSDVIHGCMQSVLGMPQDKRAHRFVPLERGVNLVGGEFKLSHEEIDLLPSIQARFH